MPAQVQSMPTPLGPAYIRSARVILSTADHVYRVRLEGLGEISVRPAIPLTCPLQQGDAVLVAGESPSSGFIIGLLEADQGTTLRTTHGAGASVKGRGADQSITVHDDHNRVVFEYFPASKKSVLRAPLGDLQLAAPDGRIDLLSGKGIQCRSEGDITLQSSGTAQVAVKAPNGGADQTLRLNEDGVRLGVHRMAVTAGQGDIRIARAVYRGKQLKSSVERAKLVYGKLETSARKMWQSSGHLFRRVRHLCQTQAGRMRTMVHGAHHTQSQRVTLIAKEDVRIDGTHINLG